MHSVAKVCQCLNHVGFHERCCVSEPGVGCEQVYAQDGSLRQCCLDNALGHTRIPDRHLTISTPPEALLSTISCPFTGADTSAGSGW